MEPVVLVLTALGAISLVTLFWLGINAARQGALWTILVLLLSPFGAFLYGIRHWQQARIPLLAYGTSLVSAMSLGAYLLHASGTWESIHTSMQMHDAVLSKRLTDRDALAFRPVRLAEFAPVTPDERQQRRLELMHDFVEKFEPSFTEADREAVSTTISRLMYGTAMTVGQQQQLVALQRRIASKPEPASQSAGQTMVERTHQQDLITTPSRQETPKPNYRLEFLPITAREARDYVGKMFLVMRKGGQEKQYKLVGSSPGALRFERRIPGGKYSFEYKHQDIESLRILAQVAY